MEEAIAKEIADAITFAERGPWEPIEDLTKDVLTPAISSHQSVASTPSPLPRRGRKEEGVKLIADR
jgi:hypothetical protein